MLYEGWINEETAIAWKGIENSLCALEYWDTRAGVVLKLAAGSVDLASKQLSKELADSYPSLQNVDWTEMGQLFISEVYD